MKGDDEIRQEQFGFHQAAPECVGTCWSKLRAEEATLDEVVHEAQRYCASQALVDFCTLHGVNGSTFSKNPCLKRRRLFGRRSSHNGKLYQHFGQALEGNPTLNLALAFHGTGQANVSKILKHGLDPKYRRTQAFGKGEYFSKEPGLAATYRHEGHCLVVFLLLVPEDHEKVYSQKDRDIVVVSEASHQLPLGVVRFEGVDNGKISHSQEMRLAQRALKQAAMDADGRATQAELMAKLTGLLQQGESEQAAVEFHQATRYHALAHPLQRELVALLAVTIPDAATRHALFPELANVRPAAATHPSNRPSIADLQTQAFDAWQAFVAMKMDPHRNHLCSDSDTTKTHLATCAQQLHQPHQTPGAMLLLDH